MGWLLHNPIVDLHGPQFLLLYGLTILATALWAHYCVQKQDLTGTVAPPKIPAVIDPYEIACLRAGENEMLRLALVSLLQQGYLKHEVQKKRSVLEAVPEYQDKAGLLRPLEAKVLSLFSSARSGGEILKAGTGSLGAFARDYLQSFEQSQLIPTVRQHSACRSAGMVWTWLFLLLGAYKCVVALSRGHHNLGFLFVMSIGGVFAMFIVSQPRRLTICGRAYLQEIQHAFDGIRSQARELEASKNPLLLFAVAAFGIDVLSATGMDFYPKMFEKAASAGTSGCGTGSPVSCGSTSSGCSSDSGSGDSASSCSSGSSCGGGCGGGGCGGCGS